MRTAVLVTTPTAIVTVTEDFLGSRCGAECSPVSHFHGIFTKPEVVGVGTILITREKTGSERLSILPKVK